MLFIRWVAWLGPSPLILNFHKADELPALEGTLDSWEYISIYWE